MICAKHDTASLTNERCPVCVSEERLARWLAVACTPELLLLPVVLDPSGWRPGTLWPPVPAGERAR